MRPVFGARESANRFLRARLGMTVTAGDRAVDPVRTSIVLCRPSVLVTFAVTSGACTGSGRREGGGKGSRAGEKMENDRRQFLAAMAQVKEAMVLGVDKNVYVEPTIWTIEWAQKHYSYPVGRSN